MTDVGGKLPNWLRWILIPFASFLTWIVVTFATNIMAKILVFFDNGRGWGENFFLYFLNPGVASYFGVYAAALMAPKGKFTTALVIAAIFVVICGASTFFTVLTAQWKYLLSITSTVVGCGAAVLQIREEFWRESSPPYIEPTSNDEVSA